MCILILLFLITQHINDFLQVWSLALVKNDKYLITGCNDNELRVWKIIFVDNKNIEFNIAIDNLNSNEESIDTDMVCIYICTCYNYTKFMVQTIFI